MSRLAELRAKCMYSLLCVYPLVVIYKTLQSNNMMHPLFRQTANPSLTTLDAPQPEH